MKNQEILTEEWDNLIILDACRYDFFEECYDKYLEGEVEKRNSGAGATPEWLFKKFDRFLMDTSYFSANPYINSLGIPLSKTHSTDFPSWNPRDYFGQIVDLWVIVDERFNTTMPEDLIKNVLTSHSLKRKIIHFIQPHLPFIHPESKLDMSWGAKKAVKDDKSKNNSNVFNKFIIEIGHLIFGTLPKTFFSDPVKRWKFRKPFVPSSSISHYEQIYRNDQLERVSEFYKYSLEKTLKSLSNKLIPNLSGKTIITSDHGECFGEYNLWGHENFNHNPILTTVPWLEI